VHSAEEREVGLAFPIDHLEPEPELLRCAIDQLVRVLCFANRRRRHGHDLRGPGSVRHGQEVAQCVDRSVDGGLTQATFRREIARKAEGDSGVRKDLQVALAGEAEHHGPPGVRADVDDGNPTPIPEDLAHVAPAALSRRTGTRAPAR
jgi:hypothetical protein